MTSSNSADPRLSEAVEQYLTDMELGKEPKRADLIAQFPELASEIWAFFENMDLFDESLAAEVAANQNAGLGQWFQPSSILDTGEEDGDYAGDIAAEIKGYNIISEIGGGGQGVVYRAEQLGTKRIVALKVIKEGAFASRSERRRFESEVELASRLNHPNVVSVYACGQDSGRDFFAMEYIDGVPLDAYLMGKSLGIPNVLGLFQQICSAVNYAHLRGIIHRDLKPSNILVDEEGQIHVLDFGLAKSVSTDRFYSQGDLTNPGGFEGTWYYASPEQASRNQSLLDIRSDVYSLGVILYEMLTDCLPYPIVDESRESIAYHIQKTRPSRPSTIQNEINDDLDTIVLYALRKEPERRYQSAAALAEDVSRYLAGEAIEAKRNNSWYVFGKLVARNRWRVGAVGAVFVALLGFAITVSILYAKADAARATTEVRGQVVRDSQRFLLDKLDELNQTGNRLRQYASNSISYELLRPLSLPLYEDTPALLAALRADLPDDPLSGVLQGRKDDCAELSAWFEQKATEIKEFESLIATHRLSFPTSNTTDSDFVLRDRPTGRSEAADLAKAFCGRAFQSFRDGRQGDAVADLETARSIALDMADGPSLDPKAFATSVRAATYETMFGILNNISEDAALYASYIEWIERDPPQVVMRYGVLAERLRWSQLLDASAVVSVAGGSGHIDLETLDRLSRGYYTFTGIMSEELRMLAQSTSPQEALAVIDLYYGEIAGWDVLSADELLRSRRTLAANVSKARAWPIVRPMITSYTTVFGDRGRARSNQALMRLAAEVCRQREVHGNWPETLAEIRRDGRTVDLLDPFFACSFIYHIMEGRPVVSVGTGADDFQASIGPRIEPAVRLLTFSPILE